MSPAVEFYLGSLQCSGYGSGDYLIIMTLQGGTASCLEKTPGAARGGKRGHGPHPDSTIRGWVLGPQGFAGSTPPALGCSSPKHFSFCLELGGQKQQFQGANRWRGSKQTCLWQMG